MSRQTRQAQFNAAKRLLAELIEQLGEARREFSKDSKEYNGWKLEQYTQQVKAARANVASFRKLEKKGELSEC